MTHKVLTLLSMLSIASLPAAGLAQATPPVQQQEAGAVGAGAEEPALEDRLVTTEHTVTIGGREIRYIATAGTMVMRSEEGEAKAGIFYIAYTRKGERDPSRRPITFSFNGGPGSSSVWLHLGALGPRRVLMSEEGAQPPPPARLVENEYSILDVTDLVFIDPVSTGYSRPAPGEDPDQFHGVNEDVASVGDFIRLYLTRSGRWTSPKFLIGESYGTTRAAGLSGYLQDSGVYLNGIMLVSSILNFQTADFSTGNDLPYLLHLPTYTAIAWYHDRLDPELQNDLRATLRRAEEFALTEYALALLKGNRLAAAERDRTARALARYTGLSEEFVKRANLRISLRRFVKELRRDDRLTVGRLDGRFTGRDRDAAGEGYEYDPSMAAIMGPYTSTLNHYVRNELGFETDLTYNIFGNVSPWNWGAWTNEYVDVAETLRSAMAENPYLKVFVANGYYDLATPYFATRYTFDHLGFDADYGERVTLAYY